MRPPTPKSNPARAYFDALKRIQQYETVEQLRRGSERQWGLPFVEALEFAYENIIREARNATRGRRRPS